MLDTKYCPLAYNIVEALYKHIKTEITAC